MNYSLFVTVLSEVLAAWCYEEAKKLALKPSLDFKVDSEVACAVLKTVLLGLIPESSTFQTDLIPKIELKHAQFETNQDFKDYLIGQCETIVQAMFPLTMQTAAEQTPSSSVDFLKAALAVQEERGRIYDSEGGERSISKVRQLFNTLYGYDVKDHELWGLMVLLKLVRMESAPTPHLDSALDATSYAALMAESYMVSSKKSTV